MEPKRRHPVRVSQAHTEARRPLVDELLEVVELGLRELARRLEGDEAIAALREEREKTAGTCGRDEELRFVRVHPLGEVDQHVRLNHDALEALALERETQVLAHEAVGAVAPDQPWHLHHFGRAVVLVECCPHRRIRGGEVGQGRSPFELGPERSEVLFQDLLGPLLREPEHEGVGGAGDADVDVRQARFLRVDVQAVDRMALFDHPRGDAHAPQHLEGPGLNDRRFRPGLALPLGLDDPAREAVAAELTGQAEADRATADHEDVDSFSHFPSPSARV